MAGRRPKINHASIGEAAAPLAQVKPALTAGKLRPAIDIDATVSLDQVVKHHDIDLFARSHVTLLMLQHDKAVRLHH